MSINSVQDEEFTKMPPSEEEPLIKRTAKPNYFRALYEQKVKPRVRRLLEERASSMDDGC